MYFRTAGCSRALSIRAEDCLEYDDRTGLELLRGLGLTEHAIDEAWRFIAYAILNLPLEECSGAALMRFARFLCGRSDYRVGLAKVGLAELFADPARRAIESAGGAVMLSTPATRVERMGTEGWRVLASGGQVTQARNLVIALPPQAAAELLGPELQREAGLEGVERLDPCSYISVYLKFDRRITQLSFWARAFDPNDLNCDFYDLAAFRSDADPSRSIITSNIIYSKRAEHLSDAEVVERTLAELAEQHPSVREATLLHARVNRIPMAIHCPRPGSERLRAAMRTGVSGLYVAGDWARTQFPSSMESACESGARVAELILDGTMAPPADDLTQIPAWVRTNARFWNAIWG